MLSGEDVDDLERAHVPPGPYRACREPLETLYIRRRVGVSEIHTDSSVPHHPPPFPTNRLSGTIQILFKCNILKPFLRWFLNACQSSEKSHVNKNVVVNCLCSV